MASEKMDFSEFGGQEYEEVDDASNISTVSEDQGTSARKRDTRREVPCSRNQRCHLR